MNKQRREKIRQVKIQIDLIKTDLKKDTSKVALANSITITPGTITVNVSDDVVCVHALDASMADGIDECDFVVKLREMEGKE